MTWATEMSDEEAMPIYKAAECLVELKLMALDRRLDELLGTLKMSERNGGENSRELFVLYQQMRTKRNHLDSKEGRMDFISDTIEQCHQLRKEIRDVLPQ